MNWDKKISAAEKFLQQWHAHAVNVYKRYEDDRDDRFIGTQRVNFFYANTNILKESLFNSLPTPDVRRMQRGDFQDDLSRVAALVVHRGLTYEINCAPDFQESIEMSILDRLVPGLGVAWCSFSADKDEEGNPIDGTEQIRVENVYWKDFLYEPARKWSKVGWVARRTFVSKKDMEKTYGENWEDKLGADSKDYDSLIKDQVDAGKICVYEIWDKRSKKVYHWLKGAEEPLKEFDDPYQLKGFFPCPKPLIANPTTNNFLPVTDYHLAQDQYNTLDVLYCRIQLIIEAIKVAGAYDGASTDLQNMLNGQENVLIPVDNWAMYAEKGGARGMIDWYPVEQVATVLQHLYAAFEATKGLLFEITGMSDIIRGASNQYETAAAQQIKAQFASVRMNGYQRDVAKFVAKILNIMAEMFTQLYSEQKIMSIIGDLPADDQPLLPEAMQVLRSDILSKYKVDISTNSLTQADWALEKEQRLELVTTVGQMIGQMMQAVEQVPQMAVLGVHLIKFAVAGFKAGTELESWIDGQLDKMAQQAIEQQNNPQPPEPSPEEKKAEMEMQKMQMDAQLKQQEAQSKMQLEQQKMQMDIAMKQAELEHKKQMAQLDMQIKQLEMAMKQQEAGLNMEVKKQEAGLNMEVKQAEAAMGLEQKQQSFEQQSQQKDAAFEQSQKQAAKAKPKDKK